VPTIPPFQVPGEIQKPGEIQAVPNVPSTAECAKQATLQPVGVFTGESFKFQFPPATGECQIPAGLILKSSEGLQDMLVMAITNDVSKGSVSRVLKFEQADLDSARLILQTAGIDPASKNLFK
jgi:hypothetical protein